MATLKTLNDDESLLVQSGKPVGVIKSHPDAPRVLIANSNLVGKWANWDHFDELEKKGLMMYGQMTAGSWIYIGTQGIVQGTYETFAQAARTHFDTDGDLSGKVVLTAGLGGMGGAQPLAVTMCGGVCLAVEIDEHRLDRRLETRYLDKKTSDLAEAMNWVQEAKDAGTPLARWLARQRDEVFPQLRQMGFMPDLITDQTSAHDPLYGYVPTDTSLEAYAEKRESNKEGLLQEVRKSMARQVNAMLEWLDDGVPVFDYGNNLRPKPNWVGVTVPSITPALCLPTFVPSFAKAWGLFGGWPFQATLRTSASPTTVCANCSRTKSRSCVGSIWRKKKSPFKVCPHASVGWVTVNASRRGWRSMSW